MADLAILLPVNSATKVKNMEFRLHGRQISSVFSLKQDENSATFALGWAISKCEGLCSTLVKDIAAITPDPEKTIVQLQRHHDDRGFTDTEIIIEAKKYWAIPSNEQLEKYAQRFEKTTKSRYIVSLSAASQKYTDGRLPKSIRKVPVLHRSWSDIHGLVQEEIKTERGQENRIWLKELEKHLRGYTSMQDPKDNTAYVLSLASGEIKPGTGYTWIDVVEKDLKYFHPAGGNGWPVIPPNYIAFRYCGKLQSVHHIDSHDVVVNLEKKNPKWPPTKTDHFVYTLGPPMKPSNDVKNGNIWPSGRYWCAIDTLLSGACATISDARDETNRRQAINE